MEITTQMLLQKCARNASSFLRSEQQPSLNGELNQTQSDLHKNQISKFNRATSREKNRDLTKKYKKIRIIRLKIEPLHLVADTDGEIENVKFIFFFVTSILNLRRYRLALRVLKMSAQPSRCFQRSYGLIVCTVFHAGITSGFRKLSTSSFRRISRTDSDDDSQSSICPTALSSAIYKGNLIWATFFHDQFIYKVLH